MWSQSMSCQTARLLSLAAVERVEERAVEQRVEEIAVEAGRWFAGPQPGTK